MQFVDTRKYIWANPKVIRRRLFSSPLGLELEHYFNPSRLIPLWHRMSLRKHSYPDTSRRVRHHTLGTKLSALGRRVRISLQSMRVIQGSNESIPTSRARKVAHSSHILQWSSLQHENDPSCCCMRGSHEQVIHLCICTYRRYGSKSLPVEEWMRSRWEYCIEGWNLWS